MRLAARALRLIAWYTVLGPLSATCSAGRGGPVGTDGRVRVSESLSNISDATAGDAVGCSTAAAADERRGALATFAEQGIRRSRLSGEALDRHMENHMNRRHVRAGKKETVA